MTTASPHWFTSSYSNNGGDCLETATNLARTTGTVPVRDSKNPTGPVLTHTTDGWTDFVTAVRTGHLPPT